MALEPRRERSQFHTLLDTNCNQQRIPWSRFHVTRVQWHSLQAKALDVLPFQPSLSNPIRSLFEPAFRSFLCPTRNQTGWRLG